jgi:hypothetical protein
MLMENTESGSSWESFRNVPFDLRVPTFYLKPDIVELLHTWGALLEQLSSGNMKPATASQREFVRQITLPVEEITHRSALAWCRLQRARRDYGEYCDRHKSYRPSNPIPSYQPPQEEDETYRRLCDQAKDWESSR